MRGSCILDKCGAPSLVWLSSLSFTPQESTDVIEWLDGILGCCTSTNYWFAVDIVEFIAKLSMPGHLVTYRDLSTTAYRPFLTQDERLSILCGGQFRKNTSVRVRMYTHSCHHARFTSMQHAEVAAAASTDLSRTRLKSAIGAYARDCTFKVHGDFFLHKSIEVAYLPVWMASALEKTETPYQILADDQGDATNDAVDPLRSTSIGDRIAKINFDAEIEPIEFIAVMSVVMELVGDTGFGVLVNKDICIQTPTAFPVPFVHMYNGAHEYGYVTNDTVIRVKANSLFEFLLTWLDACCQQKADVPALIFDMAIAITSGRNVAATSVIAQYINE